MARPRKYHLPDFVTRNVVRGIAYHRFQHPGFPVRNIPGEPWSDGFMAIYEALRCEAANAKTAALATTPLSATARPGTLKAAFLAYRADDADDGFLRFGEGTRRVYGSELERFVSKNDPEGLKPLAHLRADQVQRLFDRLSYSQQQNLLKPLRDFLAWARRRGIVPRGRLLPTDNLDLKQKPKGKRGADTLQDEHIDALRSHYDYGTRERLALEIGLNAGPRRQTMIALGWPNVVDGDKLRFQAKKNSRIVSVPMTEHLQKCLALLPRPIGLAPTTFLLGKTGKPMKPGTFDDFWEALIAGPGLDGLGLKLTSHALRKACACQLYQRSVTVEMIAAILGDSEEVVRSVYLRDARHEGLAAEGIRIAYGGKA